MLPALLRSHRVAVWAALLVTVLWSSSWVLIRWGMDDEGLAPVTFAALRYGLAAIVLVGWVILREGRHRQRYQVDRRLVVRLVLLGVVMYALTQGAVFVALDRQPAATTSLVLAMTPVFVAAEGTLPYQAVMDAMELLQGAGVSKAALMSEPRAAAGR